MKDQDSVGATTPRSDGSAAWWTLTAAYFLAACLMHLQFSLWLVRVRDLPWGRHAFADLLPAAAIAGGAVLLRLAIRHVRRGRQPRRLAACWLLWLFAAVVIDRYLTYSTNEYFHYPQYGLLAWLIARSLDPRRERRVAGRVLFWTTLAGVIDELAQYLWITTSYSHYFDFNDVLVNLVAGVGGLLVYYGAHAMERSPPPHRWPWAEWSTAVLLAVSVVAGVAAGRLQLTPAAAVPPGGLTRDTEGRVKLYLQRAPHWYGSWQDGPHRGRYYVMTPLDAALLSAMIATLWAVTGGVLAGGGRARENQAAGAAAATISRSSASKSR